MSYIDSLADSKARPSRSAGTSLTLSSRAATVLRLTFGVVLMIDAVLKWLPGFRDSYLSQVQSAAAGQPHWLHFWFHFWLNLQSGSPMFWAVLAGLAETVCALVVLFGVARRPGYLFGAAYFLLLWAVGEGFGGPYTSGATDVGTGIIYTLLFLFLFAAGPQAQNEDLSLDQKLVARHPGWKRIADFGRNRPQAAS
jgi:thiosulfate dehydrogenase (quinone) large subunit